MPSARLIVGVGNRFRSDDGVGPWVAEKLRAAGHVAQIHAGDGTGLLDLFSTCDEIILVDATRSGTPPGTLITLDATRAPLRADLFHYSTHRFGLAEAVETARALGGLPRRLTVFGIEGGDFGAGIELTAPVARAAEALAAELILCIVASCDSA
ncbi:MAG: hydrogenase maturation protease [Paracoccaceae bacterium]